MAVTYGGMYFAGIVLNTEVTQNPATVFASGYVTNQTTAQSGDAVFGSNSGPWYFANYGTVIATATSSAGVFLSTGGTVLNSGTISGAALGVYIGATTGTLSNTGTIIGAAAASVGVRFAEGGTVINGGTIFGSANGIEIDNLGGTVSNTGTIGSTGSGGVGVALNSGTIINGASNATAALIQGAQYGIQIGNLGTVVNFGIVDGTSNDGVRLTGGGTIDNLGTIEGASVAIFLDVATSVTNGQSGLAIGYIAGQTAIDMEGAGTVINYGRIAGTAANYTGGIYLPAGGTVINLGTITANGTSGDGVGFNNGGGTVTNGQSGSTAGLISGGASGVAAGGSGGTVTNYGSISGGREGVSMFGSTAVVVNNFGTIRGANHGAYLGGLGGATLTNSGQIIGGGEGVHVRDAPGTILNSGTIADYGTGGTGLRLVVGGTVTNTGAIHGSGVGIELDDGGTIINGSATSTTATIFGTSLGAIYVSSAAGTVTNFASIGGFFSGIRLAAGGTIENHVGGSITATNQGVGIYVGGTVGVVTNLGSIGGATGVAITAGGTVVNGSASSTTASIVTSPFGHSVQFSNVGGRLTNFANITGYNAVELLAGGIVVNGVSASIIGSNDANQSRGVVVSGGAASISNLGSISAGTGISVSQFASTVTNSGTIIGTGTLASTAGIIFGTGGYVGNTGTGLIQGYDYGILVNGGPGSIVNSATIRSVHDNDAAASGVKLGYGGGVTNQVGGYIYGGVNVNGGGPRVVVNYGTIAHPGYVGVNIAFGNVYNRGGSISGAIGVSDDGGVTLTNSGRISGTAGAGVYIAANSPAIVVNSGEIDGAGTAGTAAGVVLQAGGSIIDSGTISGTGGTAIYFGGTGGNLLVLEHGYKIVGAVRGSGSAGATNTLELAGSAGAPLTVNYNGLGLTNFQDVLFGPGGNGTLDLNNTNVSPGVTVSGFGTLTDIIDLTAIGTNGSITGQSSTEVTITGSAGSVTLLLDASDGTNFSTVSDGVSGTDLSIACFCRGTLILTKTGEVPAETLSIGDEVIALSGEGRAIKWIGRRAYDPRFVAGNRTVLPVRIMAGALAEGIPARDLWVSPEHALYVDGVLVAARLLINGSTIVQADRVERLEYFHIELATHDIILAHGTPAESYVECDNRGMFQNAAEFAALYPDDRAATAAFCAPRLSEGMTELDPIRAALAVRAMRLGLNSIFRVAAARG